MSRHVSWDHDDDPIVDINITPFVDIVLVLLVIFMVTAQFINTRGMNLELPESTTTVALQNQTPITLSIDRQGLYYKNSEQISLFDLQKFVVAEIQGQKKPSFIIAADKQVEYDKVISLMDVLRQQGVTEFALQLSQ